MCECDRLNALSLDDAVGMSFHTWIRKQPDRCNEPLVFVYGCKYLAPGSCTSLDVSRLLLDRYIDLYKRQHK